MPRDYQDESPTAFQRLPDYQRDDEWIRAFLRQARVGHIASTRDGQPFLNPSTFWFDEENHQIIFHSNVQGRIRSNIENNSRVCFEASELGKMLPANVALEFSLQFRSVIIFGDVHLINEPEEARRVMHSLIHKYFPRMTPGKEFREITEKELKRTSVYGIKIDEWSGKENWKDRADQSEEWPALDEKWFE
ncbi:MAG TPA: pyridoxamine 5'-phosphate oxidase family protein [Anaerolineales bacterium]|nr:pyridoxamine 5'-phosphate oxidase family protein [Anaerolineales bacterium]HLO30739.1 pyridoxamine 5'-phosphate oxidase family protein [Anaerolineales bacterium]